MMCFVVPCLLFIWFQSHLQCHVQPHPVGNEGWLFHVESVPSEVSFDTVSGCLWLQLPQWH